MVTAANCIKYGLRKIRVIGQGATPSSAQSTEALYELNALLNEIVGFGAGVQFQDIYVDSAYEIVPTYNAQRIICRHSAALTITLPEGTESRPIADGMRVNIVDASGAAATYNITVARNGWKINASAANATISTNSESRLYMFRSDLGDWKPASSLASGDEIPFPSEFDNTFQLMLAHRLGGGYGQRLSEADFNAMRGGKAKLRNKYCMPATMLPEGAVGNLGGLLTGNGVTGQDQSVA